MTRIERGQGAWLAFAQEARLWIGENAAYLDPIAARGLLNESEIARLRTLARRQTVNALVRERFLSRSRLGYLLRGLATGLVSAVLGWLLVGGDSDSASGMLVGCAGELTGLLIWATARSAMNPAAGPLLPPPRTGLPSARIGADRWKPLGTAFDGAVVAVPIVGLAFVTVTRLRGPGAVAIVAPLLADVFAILLRRFEDAVRRERLWRFMTRRSRGVPIAADLAVLLMYWLGGATTVYRQWRGGPVWLVADLRQNGGTGWLFLSEQWATSPARGPARRRDLVNMENAFGRLTLGYAAGFEQAMTTEQREAAVLEIRDHLRRALVGDLSFLDIEESARVWWLRALIRAVPAFVLTAAAVALPYLPGVTATGAALSGVRASLAVAAVLALIGTPSDTQKTVSEALKSTSSTG